MTKDEQIEILKQALYHIKDHVSRSMKGEVQFSGTWNIANNNLIKAGLRPETDNEVKWPHDLPNLDDAIMESK